MDILVDTASVVIQENVEGGRDGSAKTYRNKEVFMQQGRG